MPEACGKGSARKGRALTAQNFTSAPSFTNRPNGVNEGVPSAGPQVLTLVLDRAVRERRDVGCPHHD